MPNIHAAIVSSLIQSLTDEHADEFHTFTVPALGMEGAL